MAKKVADVMEDIFDQNKAEEFIPNEAIIADATEKLPDSRDDIENAFNCLLHVNQEIKWIE